MDSGSEDIIRSLYPYSRNHKAYCPIFALTSNAVPILYILKNCKIRALIYDLGLYLIESKPKHLFNFFIFVLIIFLFLFLKYLITIFYFHLDRI